MTRLLRPMACAAFVLALTAPALAQSQTGTRPATTTFFGDTGLWFVPTGEILPANKWSASGYRANFDREQGFTDISYWIGTLGVGVGNRVELFGSYRAVVRIDRDLRPIFIASLRNSVGGALNEHPFVREGWSGNDPGDLFIGAKFNALSEHRGQPLALAIRATVKLPTADDTEGAGTGKADGFFDAIVSKELNRRVELSGFAGIVMRGDPEDAHLSNGLRWGVGAGFPTRRSLRLFTELHGERPFDDVIDVTRPLVAFDGSVLPQFSAVERPIDATIGLIWQSMRGVFAGAGINWAARLDGRSKFTDASDATGDALGFQVRLGYHPGVLTFEPPPPPPPAPPPPTEPQNLPPMVKAQCNPCTVEVCKSSTLSADAGDPDGDPLTYHWAAPAGMLANPTETQTLWTAPCEPGPVPVSVSVEDGKGGTASDTVTLQVTRPPVKEYVFEDVHFDFDRYSLRPDATRVLDEAVEALRENSGLNVEIEGHTCNIGTAEYNLALGERRAHSVHEYLVSRGVAGDRFRTVSYGEERPKHSNAREETRRLNRRAALVVRVQ